MSKMCKSIGSDIWTRGEEFEGEYAARIRYFRKAFNEEALLAHASSLRGDIKCRHHESYAAGSFNFVTKVMFDDGENWVARLRFPPIEHFNENGLKDGLSAKEIEGDRARVLYDMQSELDTMQFVR